jgi:hypothetical protein
MKSAFHKAMFFLTAQIYALESVMESHNVFTQLMILHKQPVKPLIGAFRYLCIKRYKCVYFTYEDEKFIPSLTGKIRATPGRLRDRHSLNDIEITEDGILIPTFHVFKAPGDWGYFRVCDYAFFPHKGKTQQQI